MNLIIVFLKRKLAFLFFDKYGKMKVSKSSRIDK